MKPNNPQSLLPSPAIIAAGGEEIPVIFRTGVTARAKVRLLDIEHYLEFISLLDQEERLAEFICGQPAGWARNVATASIIEICEKGQELNFAAARRWLARRQAAVQACDVIAASEGTRLSRKFPDSATPAGN